MNYLLFKRWNDFSGWLVFLIAAFVYGMTIGHMLNTNADTIAGEAAKALAKHFDVTLVFCFEKKGVLRDENDDESVIPEIDRTVFKQLVEEGIIQGGMIPKLENSFQAIDAGVKEVIITQASEIHQGKGTKVY